MTLKKCQRIEIVIADAGLLISLARADALETLLVFNDNVGLVITDFVEFEVTRHRDKHTDAQRICEFISHYAGIVQIQETSIGKAIKQRVQMRELFEENETFREMMLSNDTVPPPIPKDISEWSIVSYANEMMTNPPGVPVLILAEDDFFLHSGSALPGNVHIFSTRAFFGDAL